MFRKMFFVVVLVLTAVVLTACSSKFQIGDTGIAPQDIVVVTDYNTTTRYKPTCTIKKGNTVEITGFSTLNLGSSEKQGLIELTGSNGCKGWVFDNLSLNNDIK